MLNIVGQCIRVLQRLRLSSVVNQRSNLPSLTKCKGSELSIDLLHYGLTLPITIRTHARLTIHNNLSMLK